MRLPIDTSQCSFLAAGAAEVATDFDTKRPKTDAQGRTLYTVSLVALDAEGASVLSVKVATEPKGLAQGTPVKVTDLVAIPWSIGDKAGVSYRAERVEPVTAARAAS